MPALFLVAYALWTVTPLGIALEARLGLETLFTLRGPRSAPPHIVLVALTKDSAQKLGLSDKLYEWSRATHASAVTRLNALGARLIVFDVYFEQARDAAGDQAFADALEQGGNVLLFAKSDRQWLDLGNGLHADRQTLAEPLAQFQQSALATAPLILPKIPARVNRFFLRHPAYEYAPTLPALAEQQVQGRNANSSALLLQGVISPLYNFYGPPRTIPTIDYADLLLQPDRVAPLLKGAVVFVGYSAHFQPDQRDGFYTAFTREDGLDVSGVELAATAYANLQDDSWLRELPLWLSLVLVWLYGLLSFAAARRFTPVISAWLLAGGAALATAGVYALFVQYYLWLPWFNGLVVQTPLAAGLGIWLRTRELHLQKQRLQRAFGKYLPEEEVGRLIRQAELPATQELHNSVCLVTDAQGYSALSEQLSPGDLSRLMQDYYSAVIGSIRHGKGLISDVAGDGVIALWPHLDRRMAWLTLAPVVRSIQTAVDEFNARHPDHPLPTRIGIHAGEIALGHFGAEDHYEFRAMGDIVNTTSRLEGVNKQIGTQILISDICIENPGEDLRNLGRFKFVGKDQPLKIYTPVRNESEELLSSYARALAVFESGYLTQARAQFQQLSIQYPADGPSQFMAQLLADRRVQETALTLLQQGVTPLLSK